MSLVYRAIWQIDSVSDGAAYLARARRDFEQWAQDSDDTPPLSDGTTSLGRGRTICLSQTGDPVAFNAERTDENTSGEVWKTTLRLVITDDRAYFMVENFCEADNITGYLAVGRPRIVARLLGRAEKAVLGSSALLRDVEHIHGHEVQVLIEQLQSETRTLPFIVFTEPPPYLDFDWLGIARKVAARAEGVANVIALDNDAVSLFKGQLEDLAVWGGGVRIYTPHPVIPGEDRSGQHRYIPARHIARANPRQTIDRLVFAVSEMSTRRRVPGVLQPGADESADRTAMQKKIEDMEFDLACTREDADQLSKDLMRSQAHIDRLRGVLAEIGMLPRFYGAEHATDSSQAPDDVQAVSEAFLAAQMYLTDYLEIPDEAARDHPRLDTMDCAVAWGNMTWRALRALAAYARDRREGFLGNFWAWCQSGRPDGWPASSKKVSMVESETVRNNRSFHDARRFPVSSEVDVSGFVYMESHLKIAEGGGNTAPRIYFLDDTSGATKKVHIRFVGPHYLVPNTKS